MPAALAGVARLENREPLVIRMLGLAGGSLAPASMQLSAAAIGIVQLVASSIEASMVEAGSVEAGSAPCSAGSARSRAIGCLPRPRVCCATACWPAKLHQVERGMRWKRC